MEFYELNRLFDENLMHMSISTHIDRYLYVLMPMLISFGCVVSAVSVVAISRPYFSPTASKAYLLYQTVFQLLFQLCTAFIFISNYYESLLVDESFFLSDKSTYFSLKTFANVVYNVFLYCALWLFTIDALDFCLIAIVKFHFNLNFNRIFKKLFYKQQARVYYQQKMIKDRLKMSSKQFIF
jgi:hypothetical protein